ncbi:EAL domain-containing protein [Dactylosporangium sp. AC04546]|uniref:putative bifunctional diguanylate cyclase/phosphodiesterase n=1 Tax=Dactylosporangium sp. AC04546 TaxID=2862460 RepID=UPI001EE0CC78|nr:EAL domain-containing protein [Dactylosporangium sp. AC04546]WVK87849.1 EAL domain-containing protein [Dactylosporangium sp. AC04546]
MRRLLRMLPSGRPLPERDWRVRHGAILWIVAAHALGLFLYGLARGYPVTHALADVLPLVGALAVAGPATFSRKVRAAAATLGLMASSAILVHLGHGMTEMHFHFFVMLVVITFYMDWHTFLLAAAFVLVEHAVVGVIAPQVVYNHADAWAHPVRFALIHALFVSGAAVAAIVNWRFADRAQNAEREIAERLAYEAGHDALTGVLNRREFDRRLAATLARPIPPEGHALCFLDLDRFKIVNDSCGHAAGDALLCQVTELIAAELTDGDVFARVGGDEFVVLQTNRAVEEATAVAERIRQRVAAHRFPRNGRVFSVGLSIGVVPITTDGTGGPDAMRAADLACYAAKNQGRNRVHVVSAGDERLDRQRDQAQWAERVMSAVHDDNLVLYYQPIVPIAAHGGSTFGELLVRMRGDDGQLIGPGAFLPAAERYNLVTSIDRWVIGAAIRRLAERYRAGAPGDETFSINVSGGSLGDEALLAFIRERLTRYRIPPRALCFEVTETVAIGDLGQAVAFITELRGLGCRFALDDFGSGLSGFTYLKQLPVDLVKIDGAFVRGITTDSVDRAMVESVNRISHEMGLRTVAEFVEDAAVLDELRVIGVDYAQGFGTGVPVPFDDWLVANPPHPAAALATLP